MVKKGELSALGESEAREIAVRFLAADIAPEIGQDLLVTRLEELRDFWAASYNTKAYVESGSFADALAGGGPVIVEKKTRHARLGTVSEVESARRSA